MFILAILLFLCSNPTHMRCFYVLSAWPERQKNAIKCKQTLRIHLCEAYESLGGFYLTHIVVKWCWKPTKLQPAYFSNLYICKHTNCIQVRYMIVFITNRYPNIISVHSVSNDKTFWMISIFLVNEICSQPFTLLSIFKVL